MPRRKKHSSAFEFTGDEAEAAEQAFRLRHAHHTRKPKISVTSISPLSAISKLLHSRSPTQTPSQPSKRRRTHSKLSKKSASATSTPQRSKENVRKPDKRACSVETPTPSPSLHTPSPARRSHRRRIPSFKLRGSVKSALETPDDTPQPTPVANETPLEADVTPQEDSDNDLRDESLGAPQKDGLKRPRVDGDPDEGDARDMTVVPRVKRPRSRGEAKGEQSAPTEAVTGNDGEVRANQHNSVEKDETRSAAKRPDLSKSDAESKQEQIDSVDDEKHGTAGDAKEEDSEKATADSVESKKTKTMDSEPEEKVQLVLKESETSGKETAEQSIQVETPPFSDAKNVLEQNESNEKDILADCDPVLSEELFQSPVTPQKADTNVDAVEAPSQDEQTKKAVSDDGQKEVQKEATKGDIEMQDNAVQDSLSTDAGNRKANAKDKEEEVYTKKVTKEQETERADANPKSSESTVEKALDCGENEQNVEAMAQTKPALKGEKKQEQAKEGQAKEEQAVEDHAKQAPAKQEPSNEKHEPTVKGSIPKRGSDNDADVKEKENETSRKRSSIAQKLRNGAERLSPGKQLSGVTKRVRFSEPSQPYRGSEKKLGFSGIVKMRRRRARRHRALDTDLTDVSVAGAGTNDSNKKDRHLLLDELQYLLDGIFSKFTNGNKKGQTPDNDVVASSLQALIRLLLKRPAKSSTTSEERQDEDSAVIVQILAEQPDLLKKIVTRFCSALGRSKTSDALLALVFVLIFRATPKLTLISEHELDLLLNAFFRSSGLSLKYNERDGQKTVEEKKQTAKEPQAKRRGKLGRMLEQKKQKDDPLPQLLDLMCASDIMEAGCTAFKTEADAAAHLMGTALSLLLRNEPESRLWMRQNRRLDRIVAVLYSCEKIMLSQPAKENNPDHDNSPAIKTGASWIVMEASLRVLEFAVLDPICQLRLARESRVGSIIIDLLRTIKSIKTGPLESELMICAALRLCINLCHGCGDASRQLVDSKGHEVVLNCLVKECLAARLLEKDSAVPVPEEVEESFDVRVLCLAVLASTVNQETSVCNSLHEMRAASIQDPERDPISLILEILRTAELESKKEEGKQNGDEGRRETIRRKKTTKEEEAERERRAQFIIERKITIGYVCLLVGALACDSMPNRERIQGRLPGQSFLGIAAVLAEFLEFHHEVGVISGSMDRMYAEIIKKIVEPEAGKDDSAAELDDENDIMKADEELNKMGSDLLGVDEDEEEEKDEVAEIAKEEKPPDGDACEKTAADTSVKEST